MVRPITIKLCQQWQKDANDAQKTGKPEPAKPAAPFGQQNPNGASLLYNGMIAPLVPYAIKGAIWYQGESNADRAISISNAFSCTHCRLAQSVA